jgi:hypothetical protein
MNRVLFHKNDAANIAEDFGEFSGGKNRFK